VPPGAPAQQNLPERLILKIERSWRKPKFSRIPNTRSFVRSSQLGYRRNEISSSSTAATERKIP
jgi:hypothetical protein